MDSKVERKFTAGELIEVIKELDPKAGDLKVMGHKVDSEGTLLTLDLRAPNSTSGYAYIREGFHGPGSGSLVTKIERIDYSSPTSEEVEYAVNVAEYKDEAWVKV